MIVRQKGKIYWPIFQLAELLFFRASSSYKKNNGSKIWIYMIYLVTGGVLEPFRRICLMALKNLQEPRNIKITQCKHEVSHFHLNYFLHVAFTAIFEAFPYIVLQTAKIVPAPTCVVWSWRLKGCSAPASAVKGSLCRAFSPISARRLRHADEV